MIHILLRDDIQNISADELQTIIDTLPSWRKEKTLKFKFEAGRRECALSYNMLAECLSKEYGIAETPEFEYGEHGKPTLKNAPGIHFNISHCKEAIAVVVSDSPVGVDVESIGRYQENVARYSMSDDELSDIISSEDREVAFTRLWTQKEAVLKLTGEGINDDMKSVLKKNKDITTDTKVYKDKHFVLSIARYKDLN